MRRQLQQLGITDKVKAQRLAALGVVRPPGHNECGGALRSDDLIVQHHGIQDGNKNARLAAGVWEEMQQLLLGHRHDLSPRNKKPGLTGLFFDIGKFGQTTVAVVSTLPFDFRL